MLETMWRQKLVLCCFWLEEEVLGGLVKGGRTQPGSQFTVLAAVEGAKGLLRGPESCVGAWSRLSQTLCVSHGGLAQGVPLTLGGNRYRRF